MDLSFMVRQMDESLSTGSICNIWCYGLRTLAVCVYSLPLNNGKSTFSSCQPAMPARLLFPFYKVLFYRSFTHASDWPLLYTVAGCRGVQSVWSWWNYRGRDGNLTGSHSSSFSPSIVLGILEIKIKKHYLQVDSYRKLQVNSISNKKYIMGNKIFQL